MQFSVDPDLIWRIFAAFLFGLAYGSWLRLTRDGQKFERQWTAFATAIGIAVDLIIAYGLHWGEVGAIIIASGLGPIGFMLVMSYPTDENFRRNKIKWAIEDSIATTLGMIDILTGILKRNGLPGEAVADISSALERAHSVRATLVQGLRGEYDGGGK